MAALKQATDCPEAFSFKALPVTSSGDEVIAAVLFSYSHRNRGMGGCRNWVCALTFDKTAVDLAPRPLSQEVNGIAVSCLKCPVASSGFIFVIVPESFCLLHRCKRFVNTEREAGKLIGQVSPPHP